ncbi:MAG: M24 family metallopeptidase [Polyangiaceae bacterium]|nr:M24 family metallopeptidase [Polyangiaceae bacterium]
MLDRATIERLSRTPEKNAPMLNVALAEEGFAPVLLALARSPAVGPEAIQVINERIANEGDDVGRDREAPADEHFVSQAAELDRLLAAHPNASGHALDSIVARHPNDPFFILAAATHPRATITGVLRAVDWPAASPMHDRLWLALLDPALVPPLTLEEWAQDAQNPLRREAAARIGRDAASLRTLSHDKDRRVRRAVASNRHAGDERHRLAHEDPAPEVRARAGGPRGYGGEAGHGEQSEAARDGTSIVETARFAAALRAMNAGGVLAPDVVRALAGPAEKLDEEGAFFAAVVLPRAELLQCLELVLDLGMHSPQAKNLAAGLALRPPVPPGTPAAEEPEGEHADLVYDAVKSLSRTTTADSRLTGKARLCAWTAEGLAAAQVIEPGRIAYELEKNPLAADRMILARSCAIRPSLAQDLYAPEPPGPSSIPASVLEIAWSDPAAPEALVIDLAGRVAKAKKRAEDILEDEVDLDPSRRSLETLERVVLAATQRVLTESIERMRPGVSWSEIALAAENTALDAGFGIVTEFVGHGVGRQLHESPKVPMFWTGYQGEDFVLREGQVLAIEPILTLDAAGDWLRGTSPGPANRSRVVGGADHWTVRTASGKPACHAEHTVLVTPSGAEVLTA